MIEVPKEKKLNIGTFYLTGEVNIWWDTVEDKWKETELTWSKFLEELRAQFYPSTIQRREEKEFMELTITVI